jgi:hypothetical protein
MPTQADIANQQQLLAAHRATLVHYLIQQAKIGPGDDRPIVSAGIAEARASIARVKRILRGWGVVIEDLPDDEPEVPVSSRSVPPIASTDPPPDPQLSVVELVLDWREQLTAQERQLWRRWVLAHMIGCILLGFGLGGAQASMLPKSLRSVRKTWFLLSTAGAVGGWFVGMSLAQVVDNRNSIFLPMVSVFLVFGTILGFVQWYFILQQRFAQAGWWVVANAIAGGAGIVSLLPFAVVTSERTQSVQLNPWVGIVLLLVLLLLIGVITGSITGISLIWLLRQPSPAPSTTVPKPAAEPAVPNSEELILWSRHHRTS